MPEYPLQLKMLVIRPLESQLKTQKWRIVSARQNLLLQKSVQAHGHTKGQDSLSLLIFLIGLALPLDLDWSRSKHHNLLHWLKCYTNMGEGLRCTAWRAIFKGKRGLEGIRRRASNYRQSR
jgi:hypothetical protein